MPNSTLSFPEDQPMRMYLGCFCAKTKFYVENRRFCLVQFSFILHNQKKKKRKIFLAIILLICKLNRIYLYPVEINCN